MSRAARGAAASGSAMQPGSQGPWVSGRVRRLDAVDNRVNGHKAIHKARHLLLKERKI